MTHHVCKIVPFVGPSFRPSDIAQNLHRTTGKWQWTIPRWNRCVPLFFQTVLPAGSSDPLWPVAAGFTEWNTWLGVLLNYVCRRHRWPSWRGYLSRLPRPTVGHPGPSSVVLIDECSYDDNLVSLFVKAGIRKYHALQCGWGLNMIDQLEGHPCVSSIGLTLDSVMVPAIS